MTVEVATVNLPAKPQAKSGYQAFDIVNFLGLYSYIYIVLDIEKLGNGLCSDQLVIRMPTHTKVGCRQVWLRFAMRCCENVSIEIFFNSFISFACRRTDLLTIMLPAQPVRPANGPVSSRPSAQILLP